MKDKEKRAAFKHSRIGVLAAAMAIAGCGGGGAEPAANVESSRVDRVAHGAEQSDLQIAESLYADNRRTPSGFLSDPLPSGIEYGATLHLKNSHIDSSIDATDVQTGAQYELCTDDWATAFNWSEIAAHQANTYADLVSVDDNARFFEFSRVRSGNPTMYIRMRVFKCSYLDRGDVDLRAAAGAAGTLNGRPLSASDLQRLSEYLWQFTRYNNQGYSVLKSEGSAVAGELRHTLTIASLVSKGWPNAGPNADPSAACDRIDVIAWRHSVDLSNGAAYGKVRRDVETRWSFGARNEAGLTQQCS